jgi:HEAT repeat protein
MKCFLIAGTLWVSLAMAAGCDVALEHDVAVNSQTVSSQKAGQHVSLSDLFGSPPPPPNKQVEMTFDPNDADKRREGIVLLSSKPWGVKEPYLKGYATILRNDDNDNVRAAALNALGKAGDATYLNDICIALSDPADKVRWVAADVLGMLPFAKTNDPHLLVAVARLRDHAKDDKSADVRAACAKSLRNHIDDDVVETLIDCLEDKEFGVRWQAHESLRGISGLDLGYERADWSQYLAKRAIRTPPATKPANSSPKPLGDLLGHDTGTRATNPSAPAGVGPDGGAR